MVLKICEANGVHNNLWKIVGAMCCRCSVHKVWVCFTSRHCWVWFISRKQVTRYSMILIVKTKCSKSNITLVAMLRLSLTVLTCCHLWFFFFPICFTDEHGHSWNRESSMNMHVEVQMQSCACYAQTCVLLHKHADPSVSIHTKTNTAKGQERTKGIGKSMFRSVQLPSAYRCKSACQQTTQKYLQWLHHNVASTVAGLSFSPWQSQKKRIFCCYGGSTLDFI